MKILVLNGPNLNFLGIREPSIYGSQTYEQLQEYIKTVCKQEAIQVEICQSNHEGVLVDIIQAAYQKYDGIIINPAAYTHTSVAILDALKAVGLPTIEVHLSELNARESFRQISYAGQACLTTFKGEGFAGYEKAILYLKNYLTQQNK